MLLFYAAIPEDGVKDELEDEDAVNPDERNPQSEKDKRIIGENEYSDSDDDEPVSGNRKDNRYCNEQIIERNNCFQVPKSTSNLSYFFILFPV